MTNLCFSHTSEIVRCLAKLHVTRAAVIAPVILPGIDWRSPWYLNSWQTYLLPTVDGSLPLHADWTVPKAYNGLNLSLCWGIIVDMALIRRRYGRAWLWWRCAGNSVAMFNDSDVRIHNIRRRHNLPRKKSPELKWARISYLQQII